MADALDSFAPLKINAKCSAPMKNTAGISTRHWPRTGATRSQGRRMPSTIRKRSAVKKIGGSQVTPVFAAAAFTPQNRHTIAATKRSKGFMARKRAKARDHGEV